MDKAKKTKSKPTAFNPLQEKSRIRRLIHLPKWAWTVSGFPGVNPKATTKPRYIRWSLIVAFKLRRIYFPLMSVRIVLLTLLSFILCYFLPQRHTGLSHVFAITSSAAALQVLTVIIGSLAAILAIIFSIVLVVVGIVRKYAYRGKLSDVFGYYPLRELLLFYVTAVVSSLYVLATISDTLTIRSIHLICLEIYFFVVALLALYPAVKGLLDVTDPVTTVPRLIKEIKKSVAQFGRFSLTGDSEVIPAEVTHPIFVLRDIAIKALSENDEVTTMQIINSMSRRLSVLVKQEKDAQNRRSIIDAFLLVWRSLMLRAVMLESEGVLFCLIDAIKAINVSTAKRDFTWFEVLELNRFHLELISKSLEGGYEEVATRAVYLLGGVFEWNIPNIPPASELFMFADNKALATFDKDSEKDLKWEHLTSDLIRLLGSAAEEAIKYNNEAVARAALSNLSGLIYKVDRAEQLSDHQKGVIIAQICWTIRDNVINGIDKLNISQLFLFIPGLDSYTHTGVLTSNKDYSKFPIIYYKDMYRRAIKKDVLTGYNLDGLRMVAFSLKDKLKNGDFKRVHKLMLYLVVLLDDVREKTESQETELARECYLAAYDKLKSIQLLVKELNDAEINNSIATALKKFKNISQLRKMQNNYDDLW